MALEALSNIDKALHKDLTLNLYKNACTQTAGTVVSTLLVCIPIEITSSLWNGLSIRALKWLELLLVCQTGK